MAVAISEEHRELASMIRSFLRARQARAASRALLEAAEERPPEFWAEFADLGLIGLHLPEEYGGAVTASPSSSWSPRSSAGRWRPARSCPR
jgi:alkylation response protein AidB-like acyl-CoA dehydrogenase